MAISLRWIGGPADGCIDVFNQKDFAKEGRRKYQHTVIFSTGEKTTAFAMLTVSGISAFLDYRDFPKENTNNGIYLGRMQLLFKDSRRKRVRELLWADKNDADYIQINFKEE